MKSVSGGWRAEWIWASQSFGMNEFAYFRKSLMITRPVRRAVLRGTAHNHYRAMVNGERVSGEVVPAPSNPEKGKLYNQYDVTAHIRLGENVLSAAVCYLGGSGQNYVDGVPGLRMQLELTYPDGSAETFGTDCSWKCLSDTPYQNHTEFSHRRRIGPMEVFDARKEPEGWQRPGFSDGDWQDAVPAPEETAAWQLKPQRIPEGIVERLLTPRLCGMAENVRVYDAGKILSGWPVLSLRGAAAGQRFTLRYSEDLDERGRVKHNVCNDTSEFYCDCYISGGRPQEEWRPDFCYKAFRYCEIESDGPLPEGCALFLAEAHTGIRQTGSFDCGDPMLNALFDACIQTQKNNALGQLVDCPHREQAQYLADADLQAESLLYHFDGAAMVEKVLADFADGQHADGSFPFVYPSNFEHPNFSLKIPEWDLHFILLLWKLFRHTGEEALLERYYLPAERTLRRQLGFVDESGLVRKTEDWHISDWPYPELEQSGSYYTVHNCLVYRCAALMSRIAQMCGRAQDAEWFSAQAGSLREVILRRFYDPARKAFRDSDGSGQYSQAVSAAAMSCGVVPQEEQAEVLARIASAGHHTSTLLSLDLLRLLFENGKGAEAYALLTKTDDHSWGRMIRLGYRTMWEGFRNIESHCHAWNAYIARIMTEYLAGIRLLAPGFRKIGVMPYLAEGLPFAEGSIAAPGGEIYVRWERVPRGYTLKCCIPEGSSAEVVFPLFGQDAAVMERGQAVAAGGGFAKLPAEMQGLAIRAEECRVQICSGFYFFTVELS